MSRAARAASIACTRSPIAKACRATRSSARTRSCSMCSRSGRTQSSYHAGSSGSPTSAASSSSASTPGMGSSVCRAARRTSSTSTATSGCSPMSVRSARSRPGLRCWVCSTARRRLASARTSVLSGHSVPATCARALRPVRPRSAVRRCSRCLSGTSTPSTQQLPSPEQAQAGAAPASTPLRHVSPRAPVPPWALHWVSCVKTRSRRRQDSSFTMTSSGADTRALRPRSPRLGATV